MEEPGRSTRRRRAARTEARFADERGEVERPIPGADPPAPQPNRASTAPDRPAPPLLDGATARALLADGDLEVVGRLVEASNLNLYCRVTLRCPDPEPDLVAACVYKPTRGERPLDDFPDGTLAFREVAAYRVSEATGWNIVPPTVLREGPVGPGMVQLWIDVDDTVDVLDLIRRGDPGLRRMAVFDAVVNNTDRKGGHLLPVGGGHIYGVDHGVCFSPDPKLRTILWGWRGRRFDDAEIGVLQALAGDLEGALGADLRELIAPVEVEATARRVSRLLARGTFPQPDPSRPAIPWPPF